MQKIEDAKIKLSLLRWSVIGMTQEDHEPTKDDLFLLLVAIADIKQTLADAIKEASCKVKNEKGGFS